MAENELYIWDLDTNNVIGRVNSVEEARAFIEECLERNPTDTRETYGVSRWLFKRVERVDVWNG